MDNDTLHDYFIESQKHQKEHKCTGVPYDYGSILWTLVAATNAFQILELGTGIGYSAACLLYGNRVAHIDTIDKHGDHIEMAEKKWRELGIAQQITPYVGQGEDVLPTLHDTYDLIFFDANTPQRKFLPHFESLLRKGGLLITTNLFLKDEKGGKYLFELQNEKLWKTAVIADTALSVKVV